MQKLSPRHFSPKTQSGKETYHNAIYRNRIHLALIIYHPKSLAANIISLLHNSRDVFYTTKSQHKRVITSGI